MKVYHSDMRKIHFCNKGARQFFIRHNLDWSEFLHSGIDADKLIATGDAMALQVVEVARGRQQ